MSLARCEAMIDAWLRAEYPDLVFVPVDDEATEADAKKVDAEA